MKKLTQEELDVILDEHEAWADKPEEGKKADLSFISMEGLDFSHRTLDHIDFRYSRLKRANFEGAKAYSSIFICSGLKEANLKGIYAYSCNFWGADLSGVEAQGGIFKDANFKVANLNNANFSGADLSHARLFLTRVKETNFLFTDFSATSVTSIEDMYSVDAGTHYGKVTYLPLYNRVVTPYWQGSEEEFIAQFTEDIELLDIAVYMVKKVAKQYGKDL